MGEKAKKQRDRKGGKIFIFRELISCCLMLELKECVIVRERKRERERNKERERAKERERETKSERGGKREIKRERDRETRI